jgi:hypothetical protein
MASSATDVDIFKFGTTKLIAALPDEIDDETATFTIRYLLNAVGTSAEKLEILVDGIYDHVTPQRNTTAMTGLMFRLLQLVSTDIAAVDSSPKRETSRRGEGLVRSRLLHRCQEEFEQSVSSQLWDYRPFEVLLELWQQKAAPEDIFFVPEVTLLCILIDASRAKHLFESQNFEIFARMVTTFGSKLDQSSAVGTGVASMLDAVAVRASSGSLVHQLLAAGLIHMRNNDYRITVNTQKTL